MQITSSLALDVNQIVNGLMSVERQPLTKAEQEKTKLNTKISSMGSVSSLVDSLKTALSNLKKPEKFEAKAAKSSDTTVATASADATAVAGSFSLVVSQLAQSHKALSSAFADKATSPVGAGTLTIANGASESFAVTVDADDTLEQVQNAINAASGNFGVTAAIIYDGSQYRLSLTAADTGTNYALTASTVDADGNNTDTSGLSRLASANLTTTQTAQNATGTLDGVAISSNSNTLTGTISGVTLNLVKAGSSTISVETNSSAIRSTVYELLNAWNGIDKSFDQMHAKGGSMAGDTMLVSIRQAFTQVFNTPTGATGDAWQYLAEVGLTFGQDGTLSLNETKFNEALTASPDKVKALFTDSTKGFGTRLYDVAAGMMQAGGTILGRKEGMSTQLRALESRITALEDKMTKREQEIRNQYSRLDTLLTTMKSKANQLFGALGLEGTSL